MIKMIKNIWPLFDKRDKFNLTCVFFLIFTGGLLETVSVSLVYPLMGLLFNPNYINENEIIRTIYELFHNITFEQFVVILGMVFISGIILKNCYTVLSIYVYQTILIKKRVFLTNKLYTGYMKNRYEFHLNHNSAELLRNLNAVDAVFQGVLQPFFGLIMEIVIIGCLLCLLLYSNYKITLMAMAAIGIPALAVYFLLSPFIRKIGKQVFHYIKITSTILLESLGGIKEIKVHKKEEFFSENMVDNTLILGRLRRNQLVLTKIPPLMIETFIITVIVISALLLFRKGQDTRTLLPMLSLFVVVAVRLMASISRLITNFQQIDFSSYLRDTIIRDLTGFLGKESDGGEKKKKAVLQSGVFFQKNIRNIRIEKVSFHYQGATRKAVDSISVDIQKGTSVAFVGETGAGKSTIVDILLGLLIPQSGEVLIDDKPLTECRDNWLQILGYVPQSIYLLDASLKNNIAFGVPEDSIDNAALKEVVRIAQLGDFISRLPAGLDTVIGERGAKISGGERQRVAIARALYHDPQVLLFDEATSALDNETERMLGKSLETLFRQKKTIITVAHRLTTIKDCDTIYFIKNGRIICSGNYDFLLGNCDEFQGVALHNS